jgi:hypothetical protein
MILQNIEGIQGDLPFTFVEHLEDVRLSYQIQL